MERKIGEIFEYQGEWYQCVVAHSCSHCDMNDGGRCPMPMRECQGIRSNGKTVIFKKLEKLGEPFTDNGKLYQRYKVYYIDRANARSDVSMFVPVSNEKFVCIEIKQNKEEMEENKLNLKPFDLEQAKAGKPVCTRDGRKARIICFDKKGAYPIVALVNDYNEEEYIKNYDEFGKKFIGGETSEDLMMLPEKKEGWTNVYKDGQNRFTRGFFQTIEMAKNATNPPGATRIATVRIEWEE